MVALLCAAPSLMFAQLRISVIGGPSVANVVEKNQLPGWDTAFKPCFSSRMAIHAGVMLEVPLGSNQHWYIQPGVIYQPKGRKFFKYYDSTTASITDTLSSAVEFYTNYIDVPVNFTYKINFDEKNKFFVSAGPVVSFFYSGKRSAETRFMLSDGVRNKEENLEVGNDVNKVKTFDFGLNARAGFEVGRFILSGFYSQGLSSFYKANYDATFNHKVVGGSIGVWLNKPAEPKKPRDKDKDGIPDNEDACPDVAGTALSHGCPDKDGDGIADNADKCPDVAGSSKYQGCPIPDTDHDGVNDEIDRCPNVAGSVKYSGCPVPDSDGDGINDENDECPNKPGLAAYKGCPAPDTDGDGIADADDKCPTVAGTAANGGCPEVKKELVEKVHKTAGQILFTLSSDQLTKQSYVALDTLAHLLRSNPALKLKIGGHTDNTGTEASNMKLSQKRADAVKKYLVKNGVEESRLEATGYGQTKPVAGNTTAAGKAKNRRVELELFQE